MKKQLITGIASLSLALGAFGQGAISLVGTGASGIMTVFGVAPNADGVAGGFSGYIPYGFDQDANVVNGGNGLDAGFAVYALGGTSVDVSSGSGTINGLNQAGQSQAAYNAMIGDGFTLVTTFTSVSGVFAYVNPTSSALTIPNTISGITPTAGQSIEATIAIVAWAGDGAAFGTVGANDGGYHGYSGVAVFNDSLSSLLGASGNPPPTPADLSGTGTTVNGLVDGLNNADLVLSPVTVPEPGTFALAGLGAAALMIFRRRR